MKLSDILGTNSTVVIKNINIINTETDDGAKPIVNPGIEYGEDDKAKWSPPLQQELSVMKSAVGVTPDADTTEMNPETVKKVEQEKPKYSDDQIALLKKLIAIFGN